MGSLFDGIGVFPLAAWRNGIVPLWASEIEKAPVSITRRHFPDMAHLGDVTELRGGAVPPVDVLTLAPLVKTCHRSGGGKVWPGPSPACSSTPSVSFEK